MSKQGIVLDSGNCDTAIRASIFHFLANPDQRPDAFEYIEDGMLILKQGKVSTLGEAHSLLNQLPDGTELHDYSGKLVMPGFFDTHTHYPQTEMIACYGAQLLEWLEKYTFPTERQFSDRQYADRAADFFCEQLLRNGTTTSAVFATIHPESVDAIFSAAQQRDMCLIAGKVMMDRNAPDYLCTYLERTTARSSRAIAEGFSEPVPAIACRRKPRRSSLGCKIVPGPAQLPGRLRSLRLAG
jgi:guanine deaminase